MIHMGEVDKKTKVFLRESSGLVREVSPWSSMMATFALVTGGVPILIISWLWLAPGINWPLSYVITLVPTLSMAFLFYVAGVSMPRSGGDYVFNSRALHPAVGFINYFGLFIAFALSLGLYSYLGARWFAYLFSGLGMYYGSSSLLSLGDFFSSTVGSVVTGVAIVVIGALISFYTKALWKFVLLSGVISLVTTVAMFALLTTIHPTQFASSLSSFTGIHNAYHEVIANAEGNGLSFVPNPVLSAFLGIPVIWYFYTWYNLPASWSGEMKSVKKNVLYSVILAILLIGAYYVLFTQLNIDAFGEKFLTSWGYISCNGVSDPVYSSLSSISTFTPFFVLITTGNVAMYLVMFIAFWLPNFYSNPPLVISLTRYMFAWSFDRIFPEWFADVNSKLHVPVKSTALVALLGVAGVLMYAFVPFISIVDVTVIFEVSYAVFAFSIALMPFLRKSLYEGTVPASVRRKFLGIPAVTWLGFLTFGFLVYALAITWGNPVLLPINFPTIASLAAIYGLGVLIYVGSYVSTKKKGIEPQLIFKEIPPE
ncbi:hypothetical protein IC006_2400 [Sulfuracidifex tepidarius]|uniref:Amino acid permease/ SLC12A domain-containing protein n=1 Tax=Sulfuracidifex tepidarius TaxID=1294262 RepID=A0A510DXX9_9CREN|nr:APC family permease [Sulfuracidifex tepidarius]BBG25065.1 hypothetical protein IC006_2400 [Sulfuracidifex tepidarius]